MQTRAPRSAEEVDRLIHQAFAGDRSALARLLSEIEQGEDGAHQVDIAVSRKEKPGYTIGITGAPGAGKSTLVGSLLSHVVQIPERAAALLVDPSSPISRGALLGDRLRLQGVAVDKNIFVRSMASRGRVGGLADMTRRAVRCLAACQWPWVLIETVGIGQVDIDVSTVADVVVVVLNPGAGDEVQVFKAGLMEIADIFVINKADHPLTGRLRQDLAGMIGSIPAGRPRPSVVETVATTGQGVADLWSAISENIAQAERSGELSTRRSERLGREIKEIASRLFNQRLEELSATDLFAELKSEVTAGNQSLHAAALHLLGRI